MKRKPIVLALAAMMLASCGGNSSAQALSILPVPEPSTSSSTGSSSASSSGSSSSSSSSTSTSKTNPTSSASSTGSDTSGSDTGSTATTPVPTSTDTATTSSSSSVEPEIEYALIGDKKYNIEANYRGYLFVGMMNASGEEDKVLFDDGNVATNLTFSKEGEALDKGSYQVSFVGVLRYEYNHVHIEVDPESIEFKAVPFLPSLGSFEEPTDGTTQSDNEQFFTPVYVKGYVFEDYGQLNFVTKDDKTTFYGLSWFVDSVPPGSYIYALAYRKSYSLCIMNWEYGTDKHVGECRWKEDYSAKEYVSGNYINLTLIVPQAYYRFAPALSCDDENATIWGPNWNGNEYTFQIVPSKTGELHVTAMVQGVEYPLTLNVKYDQATSVVPTSKSLSVMLGDTFIPEVTILPETANQNYFFYSSDYKVLRVNEDGKSVTAIGLPSGDNAPKLTVCYRNDPNDSGYSTYGEITVNVTLNATTYNLTSAKALAEGTHFIKISSLECYRVGEEIRLVDPNDASNYIVVDENEPIGSYNYVYLPNAYGYNEELDRLTLSGKYPSAWSSFIKKRVSTYCIAEIHDGVASFRDFHVDGSWNITGTITVTDNCAELGIPVQRYSVVSSATVDTAVTLTLDCVEGKPTSILVDHGADGVEDITETLTFTAKKVNDISITYEKVDYEVGEKIISASSGGLKVWSSRYDSGIYDVEGMATASYGVYRDSSKIQFYYNKSDNKYSSAPNIGFLLPANARLTGVYTDISAGDSRVQYSIAYGEGEVDGSYIVQTNGKSSWNSLNRDDSKLKTEGGYFFATNHGAINGNYVQFNVFRVNDGYDMTTTYGASATSIRITYILLSE